MAYRRTSAKSAGSARPPDGARGGAPRSSLRTRWRRRRRPGAFWSRAHEYTVKLHKDALVQVVPTKSRPSLRFRGVIWRVEEARLSACVAGRSRGAHPQENGVEVGVEAHLDDLHGVARGRPLLPQTALARTEPAAAPLPSLGPHLLVH